MAEDPKWVNIQKKTFTKWCNSHLVKRKHEPIVDIIGDFETGIKLMELVNALYDIPMPLKYNKAPKMRPHKLDNIELALKMLEEQAGVKTNFLKHTHLVDKDSKMLLGMIWSIILDYQIKGITVEELSAKEGLLLWCKKKTHGYKDVKVENFTTSWQDGLAFCALIHKHRPDLLNFDELSKSNPKDNLELAFSVAEKSLGIPRLLDIEDLVDVARPDERSVITYVSEYFHCFSALDQNEVAGRRIANLVALTKTNDQLKADYDAKAQKLVNWINSTTGDLQDRQYENTLESIEAKYTEYKQYQKETKTAKTQEKLDVETALNQLQAKLRLNNRPPYQPPAHLTTAAINEIWEVLGAEEKNRVEWIRKEMDRQHKLEALVSRFWRKAAALLTWGQDNTLVLSSSDYGDSVASVEAKLKNHESWEANFAYTQRRLDACKGLAAQLVAENYGKKDLVNAKVSELEAMWVALRATSDKRRAGLEAELARQKKLEDLRLNFARKVRAFATWIEDAEDGEIAEPIKTNSLENIKIFQANFAAFSEELAKQESEFQALLQLSDLNISEGITSNMYSAYTIDQISDRWNRLKEETAERKKGLDQEQARLSENDQLCLQFGEKAQAFVQWAASQKADLTSQGTGTLEEQLQSIKSKEVVLLQNKSLEELASLQLSLDERNVAFNNYTDQTIQSLTVLFDSVKELASKQQSLLEKAILDASGSGVSAEQLAEFKDTFKAFDKDHSGTLEPHEFKACLSALGHDISDASLGALVKEIGKATPGKIQFEEFVEYMVAKTEGGDSPNTIKSAFKQIAGDREYVTESDLRKVPGLDQETITWLLSKMPEKNGTYDYAAFTEAAYKN